MSVRVGMVSLGCPKNQVDAEMLLYLLRQDGYELEPDPGLADVVVVNTCGFIESAKQESIENILEFCQLKKEGRIKCVVATGCLAERYREELVKEIPELDVVLGIGSNEQIAAAIKQALSGHKSVLFDAKKEDLPLNGGRVLSTLPFFAYLKIAEGCDNCCSYCAIPSIRGRFRSREMADILAEANWLAGRGVTELVVVAQDTTRYGEDLPGGESLAKLLKELCKIDGFRWIRVLYCYPERITDELLETIASEEKLVKYLDIPLQHANGRILKAMHRHGDRQTLTALLTKIRQKVPGIILRTTLIAGFPGETEQEFEELCEFVGDIRFERLGCFAYSQEEGTPAARMEGQLSEEEKIHRAELVMEQQMFIMSDFNESQVGKTLTTVVEGYDRYAEAFFGRTAMDAPDIDGKVFFTSKKPLKIGQYVGVRIDEVLDYDLTGEAVKFDA